MALVALDQRPSAIDKANMEFFRNPNINFLKYKWYFLAFSLIFSVAGVLSMLFWHGVPLGVEFRGQYECFIDNVANPAAFFAGLKRSDPPSRMVRE